MARIRDLDGNYIEVLSSAETGEQKITLIKVADVAPGFGSQVVYTIQPGRMLFNVYLWTVEPWNNGGYIDVTGPADESPDKTLAHIGNIFGQFNDDNVSAVDMTTTQGLPAIRVGAAMPITVVLEYNDPEDPPTTGLTEIYLVLMEPA